ncbi:hypothetical protein [Deinococcus soli (ex Cha et al. 2016)]|uniref:Uncharacterized protein n=2 Tax=Deinococcus soli (ex Cha et al. 2016) TaxID=1309411 RepID=A0ACC6KKH6_9DEIO|nr:hypothetical protein [Deinococcus soli (ex Cha et al. 2016)]MDR6328467.1 hypothetical protein [Deinococcus soli (ex Cha et al. 2016)]MDR6753078.1 hypothetical protein [Deinococcus soli (ex Cha et al. 2016)]
MAKSTFERAYDPSRTVGHVDHGKTTLTAAITVISAHQPAPPRAAPAFFAEPSPPTTGGLTPMRPRTPAQRQAAERKRKAQKLARRKNRR